MVCNGYRGVVGDNKLGMLLYKRAEHHIHLFHVCYLVSVGQVRLVSRDTRAYKVSRFFSQPNLGLDKSSSAASFSAWSI
jgi:hypothetical protein